MPLMNYRPLGSSPDDPRFGRFIPEDFKHVEKYPYSSVRPSLVENVEKTLVLPSWHWTHDQGFEGSCVGHGSSMERSITNTAQNKLLSIFRGGRRYDPLWLWNQAKLIDEWPDTNPGDDNGTSVRAAYDVLRDQGHRRISTKGIILDSSGKPVVVDKNEFAPDVAEGVLTNRWATAVDEIRTALAHGMPVTIGVTWYSNFDRPVGKKGSFGRTEYFIGIGDLGKIRGGHCVCIYGASDKRQAFKVKNSWGKDYPLVWITYAAMERLLSEYGEATIITDR